MSWRGLFSAWSRLSRLNSCPRCGHSWYPRGHLHSRACPACGQALTPPRSSSGIGCIGAVVALVALGWSISTFGERTVGAFFGLCAVAFVAVMVARWQLRLRDERAADAAADHALLDARREREARFERLIAEHGADAAMRIADGKPWQGATQAMVTEMLGPPEATASRVYKTKTSETWKYRRLDAKHFALTVSFEDGVCVGWEERDA